MLKVGVVNPSLELNSYTGLALNLVIKELENFENLEIVKIDLVNYNLPFPGEQIENDNVTELRNTLASCDGFILGTPEYNGTFTAKLKLMFENCSYPSELKGKPVSLLGIASGVLGAVKSLEHLRSVCSHIGSFVLPRFVSIAEVEKKFDIEGNCLDQEILQDVNIKAKNFYNLLSLMNNQ